MTTGNTPLMLNGATLLPSTEQWRMPVAEAALPFHVQALERSLDMSGFINQLEKLLSTSTETAAFGANSTVNATTSKNSLLCIKGIWSDDNIRKQDLSRLYNFRSLGKRKWLKNILLEESDSDSDADQGTNETDLQILLKVHKLRRNYQKQYHSDILNSQYTYYSAGMLSEVDRFPEHQKFILAEYGFGIPQPAPVAVQLSPPKKTPVKRRRNSPRCSVSSDCPVFSSGNVTATGDVGHSSGDHSTHPSTPTEHNSSSFSMQQSTVKVLPRPMNNDDSFHMTLLPLAKPVLEPRAGDMSPEVVRWRTWKTIALEEVPKAYTDKKIQGKYKSVVLKQMAVYCAQFLEQSRDVAISGKAKQSGRHGKRQQGSGQILGLRPVKKN